MIWQKIVKFHISIIILASLAMLAGCNNPKDRLATFNTYYETADYENSSLFAEQNLSLKEKPKGEDLLWSLQLASVERDRQNYPKSTQQFDNAEDMLKFYDKRSEIGDAIIATAVNDNAMPYKGEEYDGIMVNTYKALNFMAAGQMDLARVELNRSMDRQRRAKEHFAAEISDLESSVENNSNKFSKSNVENPQIQQLLEERYPNLRNFEPYPDFINPFATYIAGVYFSLVGEGARSSDLLKETLGMVANNKYIAEDLYATETALDAKGSVTNTVWLIFENGLGPVKDEFRMDIPLFIETDKIRYIGIALPQLRFRAPAHEYLTAVADGRSYQTAVIADMDRIIQTEFEKDYGAILTRTILSASAKAVAQYSLEKESSEGSAVMAVLMSIYSFSTTAADVRIWTTLPKNFQVARFTKPKNGTIEIIRPGMLSFEVQLPDCNNAIVYVKIPTCHAGPIYEVMTF
jgi:hypothetical protein